MRELLKATTITSLVAALNIVVSIIRSKVLAILIGPEGLGIVSQIINFLDLSATLLSLGMGVGITKYVAQYRAENRFSEIKVFVTTVLLTSVFISSTATLVVLIWSGHISSFALGTTAYSGLIIIGALALPARIASALVNTVLQGLKEIKKMAQITALVAVVGLGVILILVSQFQLPGVIWGVLVGTLLNLVFGLYFLRKAFLEHKISDPAPLRKSIESFSSLYRPNSLTPLLGYGTSSLLVNFVGQSIDFLIRSDIIRVLGATANGIYQASFVISNNYVFIVLNSMSVYSLPRFSEIASDVVKVREEIRSTLRFSLITITPMIVGIMATNQIVIPLLFSHKFLEATTLLPIQLVSDFFQAMAWSLGMCLLPTKQIKFWLGLSLGFQIFSLIFFKILLPYFGLQTAVYSYLMGWIASTLAILFFLAKKYSFHLKFSEYKLISLSLILILLVLGAGMLNIWLGFIASLLLLPWGMLVTSREERKIIIGLIRKRLTKLGLFGVGDTI